MSELVIGLQEAALRIYCAHAAGGDPITTVSAVGKARRLLEDLHADIEKAKKRAG